MFQVFVSSRKQTNQAAAGPVTLTYWGLWEEDSLMKTVIAAFEKQNPNIKVNYVRSSSQNYRTRTQTQIKAGQGPDILRIHNTWLSMFDGYLSAAPAEVFTVDEYKKTFYPIAADSFIKNNQIFAAPMEIDGLALFYNEDILNAAGIGVPRNWQQFFDSAVAMTVKDPQTGVIQTAGAAMGDAVNVDHWSDIVGLLLLQQPGVNLGSLVSPGAADVLRFYTKFETNPIEPTKTVWSKDLPKSTDMFARGKLAFYFAPSWRAHELRVANPSLKFKIVPVPQLSSNQVAWGSFWAEAVSATSKHPKEAWQFIKFLTSAEAEKLMYTDASKIRLFGEPYSRTDLKTELANDPLAGAFVQQGPIYKSWYLSSSTLDAGLNDQIIKYFEDGINSIVNRGQDPQAVLQTVDAGVKQVIGNINKPVASPAPAK